MSKLTKERVIKSIADGNRDFEGWDLSCLDLSCLDLNCENLKDAN